MVLANILAPVLISEAADLSTALTPGGRLVLSGMRHDQVSNVISHFGSCSETASETQDGWTAVVLTKN
jgi:ribosomal protein L11 methylase PrmA